ncbi:MAG: hypothetical protein IT380_20390 [Myxococcales bacterium]|nr:hypothetical protein [Myxococcales bacterium]
MSQLPRPVKQVLASPSLDARVVRTWVRLERTRRGPRAVRPAFVLAGLAAAAALAVAVWARAPSAARPQVGPAPVADSLAAPEVARVDVKVANDSAHASPSVPPRAPTRVWWKGRPTPGAPRPSLVQPGPGQREDEAADSVGALLSSADEAWRAQDTVRAASLLSELAAHHPEDARAGQALYLLGQMQLDVLERPGEAVKSFQRALQLGVPEELVGPLWQALERAQPEEDDALFDAP